MSPGTSRRRPRGAAARLLPVALAGLLAVAACSNSGSDVAPAPSSPPRPTAVSTDRPGGTLRIVGTADVSGDPGWATTTAERLLVRMTSRQLYAYPAAPAAATPTPGATVTPTPTPSPGTGTVTAQPAAVPDLALKAPVGTDGGLTWTVTLRGDVRWDVPAQRQVTATDVARGLKRLCLPPKPSPMRGWYATSIAGYAAYCAGLLATPAGPKQQAYLENKQVSGIDVVGNGTLVLHLLRPANDITSLLALPAASAVPAEELGVAPDSKAYRQLLISDGPYSPSPARAGESARLSRNPAWAGGGDRVRRAYVDHVSFRFGLTADAVQRALAAGQADMAWDTPVPAAAARTLAAAKNPMLTDDGAPDLLLLAFGLNGPSHGLRTPAVRQALGECIDRTAIASALGSFAAPAVRFAPPGVTEGSGGAVTASATPTSTATPSATGSATAAAGTTPTSGASPGTLPTEPTPAQPLSLTAAPAACHSALSAAKAPKAPLVLLQRNTLQDAAVTAALRTSFTRAGVRLTVRVLSPAQYDKAIVSPFAQSWDLTAARVPVEWWGTGSRAVLEPLVDSRWVGDRSVDGGYRSPEVDSALDAALAEQTPSAVAGRWAAVETDVLDDAALLPLATVGTPRFHGRNVRGWVPVPALGSGDPTTLSLATT